MFWAPTSRARERAKKLVAQVHVHAVIPVFGFDLILRQTVVIARIVDKGAKRTDGTR